MTNHTHTHTPTVLILINLKSFTYLHWTRRKLETTKYSEELEIRDLNTTREVVNNAVKGHSVAMKARAAHVRGGHGSVNFTLSRIPAMAPCG